MNKWVAVGWFDCSRLKKRMSASRQTDEDEEDKLKNGQTKKRVVTNREYEEE